ncbi:PrsW family glutamic-type intramembrane protease [Asanoa sp. NPDC049518]|uniref:PrsW family glutamic-type intramembrane protease n=1 Tax=unclassified Asanoa TaxID=2685164 RepID=UPI0034243E4D
MTPVHPTPEWAHPGKSLLLPAFWVVLMLIAGGAVRLGLFVRESFAAYPTATLLALVLFGLYAVPFCVFVAALDYLEREPPLLLATAFAWGGLVATSISIRGNAAVHNLMAKLASPGLAAEWGSALAGPTVEEIAKALGIVAIVLVARAQVNSVLDGVVYGSLVGLGFQVVEDVVYAVNAVAVAGQGDQVAPVVATFLLRGFLAGLWSHTLFGALAGAGIGYLAVRTDRPLLIRVSVAVLAVLGAMGIHFLWNSPLLSLGGGAGIFGDLFVKGIPPLLMILFLVRGVRHREADYYMAQLAALGDRRIATEEELRVLAQGHLRAGARRHAHGRCGVKGRRAVSRLQRAQARLAVELSRASGVNVPGLRINPSVSPGPAVLTDSDVPPADTVVPIDPYASAAAEASGDPVVPVDPFAPAAPATSVGTSDPAISATSAGMPVAAGPPPTAVAVGVARVAAAPVQARVLGGPAAVRWRDRVLVERGRMLALGHPEATAPLTRNGSVRRVVGGIAVFLTAMVTVGLALIALGAS